MLLLDKSLMYSSVIKPNDDITVHISHDPNWAGTIVPEKEKEHKPPAANGPNPRPAELPMSTRAFSRPRTLGSTVLLVAMVIAVKNNECMSLVTAMTVPKTAPAGTDGRSRVNGRTKVGMVPTMQPIRIDGYKPNRSVNSENTANCITTKRTPAALKILPIEASLSDKPPTWDKQNNGNASSTIEDAKQKNH